MNSALTITNLQKNYNDFVALKNISFSIEKGEIFGLLGPNGAGKTTTLSCIEGVTSFNKGTIEIFGTNINKNPSIKDLIGVQLQSSSLPKNITVLEAMTLICKWKNIHTRRDLLETFGLKNKLNTQYQTLSTGLKRRLHLALAMAHNPKILFLDEPTAGLDIEGRFNLHQEIKKLKENGTTIILASHDMAEVESLCDRVAIIVQGSIAAIGTPLELSTVGTTSTKLIFTTKNRTLSRETKLNYSTILDITSNTYTLSCENLTKLLLELTNLLNSQGETLLDLKTESLSLEERFMKIISQKEIVI